ncbi:MAG TPA: CVNH domain-containing protein [Nevskiaceae bacterium]|nr:CVNH domain-containing protein [Nevskiaceae bacterium]
MLRLGGLILLLGMGVTQVAHADPYISCSEMADYANDAAELSDMIQRNRRLDFNSDRELNDTIRDLATAMLQLAKAEKNQNFIQAARDMKQAWRNSDEQAYAGALDRAADLLAAMRTLRCPNDAARPHAYSHDGALAVPRGPYQNSCEEIRMTGDGRLHASCRKRNGHDTVRSYIEPRRCSTEILNENGALVCDGYHPKLPTGPYADQCRDLRMDGYDLSASCLNNRGRRVDTVMTEIFHCLPGTMRDDNGLLACDVKEND